jgi:hypothetical protein
MSVSLSIHCYAYYATLHPEFTYIQNDILNIDTNYGKVRFAGNNVKTKHVQLSDCIYSREMMKGATLTYIMITQYSIFYAKFSLINYPKGNEIQLLQKTIAQYHWMIYTTA